MNRNFNTCPMCADSILLFIIIIFLNMYVHHHHWPVAFYCWTQASPTARHVSLYLNFQRRSMKYIYMYTPGHETMLCAHYKIISIFLWTFPLQTYTFFLSSRTLTARTKYLLVLLHVYYANAVGGAPLNRIKWIAR